MYVQYLNRRFSVEKLKSINIQRFIERVVRYSINVQTENFISCDYSGIKRTVIQPVPANRTMQFANYRLPLYVSTPLLLLPTDILI